MKGRKWVVAVLVLAMLALAAGCGGKQSAAKQEGASSGNKDAKDKVITIGIWGTITGPDSDVNGMSYGTRDYFEYLNEKKGGVMGYKYNPILLDGKYSLDEEVKNFKRFVTVDKAVVINGWSTGSAKALRDEVNNVQKVPFLSETMISDVVDPKKYPFTFTLGPSYEDQMKIALTWAKSKGAKKVAFVHNDAEYGTAPVTNVINEKWAESVGLEVVANISYPFKTTDLTTQMLTLKNSKADVAYIQDSVNNVVIMLRDAAKVGLPANMFIGNFYGVSPIIPQTVGKGAEGFKAIQVFSDWGTDMAMMKQIEEFAQKHNIEKKDQYYIKGWTEGVLIGEAIERALKKANGKMPEIQEFRKIVRDEMEGISNFDVGGAVSPVSYGDHKGVTRAKIVEIKDGKYTQITDWVSVGK